MALLNTVIKRWIRWKTDTGYITLKPKTDADCVKFTKDDGAITDLQTEVTAINNNITSKIMILNFNKSLSIGAGASGKTKIATDSRLKSSEEYEMIGLISGTHGSYGDVIQLNYMLISGEIYCEFRSYYNANAYITAQCSVLFIHK